VEVGGSNPALPHPAFVFIRRLVNIHVSHSLIRLALPELIW
jgi:hypothetical protein